MKRFNQLSKVLLLFLAVLARPSAQAATPVGGTPAIARGPLREHPTNPRYNAAGTPARNAGIQTTPLDLARLGHLYLNRGNWNGRQLLSAAFVDQATTNQVPVARPHATGADPGGRYGFYWWTNGRQRNGQPAWPAAPARTYSARGADANACFVVPEWNLGIARLAAAAEDSRTSDQTWNTFFGKLGLVASEPEPAKRRTEHGSSPSKLHL